jgi:hypothetical protein
MCTCWIVRQSTRIKSSGGVLVEPDFEFLLLSELMFLLVSKCLFLEVFGFRFCWCSCLSLLLVFEFLFVLQFSFLLVVEFLFVCKFVLVFEFLLVFGV